MAISVGCSLGSSSQLSTAPRTGIINFHMFKVDSFTPDRFSKVYQIEIAAADRKLSQASDNQYSKGNGPDW